MKIFTFFRFHGTSRFHGPGFPVRRRIYLGSSGMNVLHTSLSKGYGIFIQYCVFICLYVRCFADLSK
jgi:hypothetical protein